MSFLDMLVAVGWSGLGQLLSSGTLDLLRWDNSSFHLYGKVIEAIMSVLAQFDHLCHVAVFTGTESRKSH